MLYSSNYGAARHPGSWIAYVRDEDDARLALATSKRWQAFIVADELNIYGVSPEEYGRRFAGVYRILGSHAPVATQGLAAQGSWWRELFWAKRFDDAYHRALPDAQLRSFNPNKVSLGELRRVLNTYSARDWILSPAPFNDPLNRLRQPVDTTQWLALAERADVFGIAFWNLIQTTGFDRETYQTHGLLDRFGRLTATGTVVQRYLVTPSARYGRVRPRPTSADSGQ